MVNIDWLNMSLIELTGLFNSKPTSLPSREFISGKLVKIYLLFTFFHDFCLCVCFFVVFFWFFFFCFFLMPSLHLSCNEFMAPIRCPYLPFHAASVQRQPAANRLSNIFTGAVASTILFNFTL